jgi:hypothetical protein
MLGAVGPLATPRVVMRRPILVRRGAALRPQRILCLRVTAEYRIKVCSSCESLQHVIQKARLSFNLIDRSSIRVPTGTLISYQWNKIALNDIEVL